MIMRPLLITFALSFAVLGASYGLHAYQTAAHACDAGCRF